MTEYIVNDKPAVRIYAKVILDNKKYRSILFNCEGDQIWIPRTIVQVNKDDTILVQEWFYNEKLK